ncbi:MAG: MFS transporter, partial [Actinomycetota bacterium]|nr:MFS transporter [Actinomycetota bacterium]
MGAARPDDLDDLERALLDGVEGLAAAAPDCSEPLDTELLDTELIDTVFSAQLDSRHLDHAARWLRVRGLGFYTIGSAGHESNAWVAAALAPTDPALLHYRSGGFYLARSRQVVGNDGRCHDGVRDVLLGLLASVDEPIAGGRHKVFGHPELAVI